jgi:hypothetical protein
MWQNRKRRRVGEGQFYFGLSGPDWSAYGDLASPERLEEPQAVLHDSTPILIPEGSESLEGPHEALLPELEPIPTVIPEGLEVRLTIGHASI